MDHQIEEENGSEKRLIHNAVASILGQPISLGSTLQIGFANALSLHENPAFSYTSYTILEKDAEKIGKAKENITAGIIFSAQSWQEALKADVCYDTIIFNHLDTQHSHLVENDMQTGHHFLSKAEIMLRDIHTSVPHLTKIKYSLEEITTFFDQQQGEEKNFIARFAQELKENNQISEEVYAATKQRYGLKEDNIPSNKDSKIDPVTSCLLHAVESHLHPKGKFIAISTSPISKFEDPLFFEKIITDTRYHFQEKSLPYQRAQGLSTEGLIFVVEKME